MLALSLLLALSPVLPQAPLHTFHGDSPNDEFGVSVALVGDANRDGYADILVGAHWDDNNGSNSGSARLFSGLDGSVLGTFNGDAANDFFGLAVAGVGDVDYDGFDDFAVGADGSDAGGIDSGLVRVISGKTGTVIRNIFGPQPGEQMGDAIAGVFDSGNSILIGSPSADAARVVSGSTGALVWYFPGNAAGDGFGSAVASGRDLTGDGVPDFAIGAPNDDIGGTDSGSVTLINGASGNVVRTLRGASVGDRFGTSVALIPDADGDGRAEVVVGAPRHDGPGSDAGAIYVYSGTSGSLIFSRSGEAAGDQFGCAVSDGSTRTGNPVPAFVVGARWNDAGGNNAGAAYVYSALTGLQLRVLRGHSAGDWFGGAVAGGGDVNGDGIGDLAISARLADINGTDSGSVEVHSSPLTPSTWYVDAAVAGPGTGSQGDPYRSIQYAINRATTKSGDTVLVQPGTYFENLDFTGKSIALVGNGGPGDVVIDGQQLGNCVRLVSGEGIATRLQWLTIVNGDRDYLGQEFRGGGVIADGPVLIEDCQFFLNTAEYGAAVDTAGDIVRCLFAINGNDYSVDYGGAVGSARTIAESVFESNECNLFGGAVAGAYLVDSCLFTGNISHYQGGAIGGVGLLRNSVIESNHAYDSGGGLLLRGQAVVENCIIESNSAGGDDYPGGGIFVDDFQVPDAVVVRNSRIAGNYAAGGGGAVGGHFYDCTFSANTAFCYSAGPDGIGGGILDAYAERCVFIGNQAKGHLGLGYPGQGGAAYGSTLVSCTMYGNRTYLSHQVNPPQLYPGGAAAYDSVLLDCIGWGNMPDELLGTTTATYSDIAGGWPGTGNINDDPLFVNAAYGDVHLTALSPCIDSGSPALPLDPDGSRADMGAFPYDPNYCPPPLVYCTAKTNSCGQLPVISFTGFPHAGATSGFVISASGARSGKGGLLLYSPNGAANSPFQGGTLCIASQGLRRGVPVVASGGTGGFACDAIFTIDWAAYSAGSLGGTPQPYLNQLGQRVNVQWWGRDNLVIGSFLSNAIQYEVCP